MSYANDCPKDLPQSVFAKRPFWIGDTLHAGGVVWPASTWHAGYGALRDLLATGAVVPFAGESPLAEVAPRPAPLRRPAIPRRGR